MTDLLAGDSAQDDFQVTINVEELLKKIETMDPDQADDVVAKVQEAINKKEAGGDTMKTIMKVIGSAVGFII